MDPYAQMLASAPAQQQPSAPSAQMPGGGMPQGVQDPTSFESATAVQVLEKLGELWAGDEQRALKVQRMALELKRLRLDREKSLKDSMQQAQAMILPQML